MFRVRTSRLALRALAALAASTLVLTTAPLTQHAQATGPRHGRPTPEVIELPDGFRPEGIAIRGKTAYLGSLGDGDIYAANLASGKGRVISQGPGTMSVGLKVDHRNRLFVAGGGAGDARVVSARTGRILASYRLAEGASFVNDVVLTPDAAWFTDSMNPVLYAIPLVRKGGLPDPDAVVTLPLSGEYQHGDGFNLNGIARTPDGKALLVVHTLSGILYRVDPATGHATIVDLGGASVMSGDGMLLRGRTLYVVQNELKQVSVLRLNRAGTSGRVVDVLTSPHFDAPTTVASHGRWLYLPSARFSTPPTPDTAYWVTRISR